MARLSAWQCEVRLKFVLNLGVEEFFVGFCYVGVSKNNGTPKSSILTGFSIINHPFWGTPIFGNIHVVFP